MNLLLPHKVDHFKNHPFKEDHICPVMSDIDTLIWFYRKAETIFNKLVFELSNFDHQRQIYDQLKNVGFIAKRTSNFKCDNSNDTGL